MKRNNLLAVLIFCFLIIFSSSISNSGTIDCSYKSDYQKNQKNMGDFTQGYVEAGGSGSFKADLFALAAGAIFNSVDEDKFYCIYQEDKVEIKDSSKTFYNMLQTREIIPVYLYEGLSKKFYEEEVFNDINTPYSKKRDETAGKYAFVFSENSVKSNIKYFGFYTPVDGKFILWSVNKKTGQFGALEKDEYKAALEYTKYRDTTRSVEDLHAISKFGEFDAINTLCSKYYTGKDVKQNYKQAIYYCSEAANKGGAYAQNLMGVMNENGFGTAQNNEQAFQWYLKASQQDFTRAHTNLIPFYLGGKGIEENYTMAFNLAMKAANKKDASGQTWLGLFYEEGIGTQKDLQKSFEFYKLGADNDNPYAQNKLGELYEKGNFVVKANYKEAEKWYRKAAKNGYKDAEKSLKRFNN